MRWGRGPQLEEGRELDLRTAAGVFIVVFWPVSVVLSLGDLLFFRGHLSFPLVLIVATVVGIAAVWRHLENQGGAQSSA